MIPTRQALSLALEEAQAQAMSSDPMVRFIKVGGAHDLDRPIGDLLDDEIRLIIIYRMGEEPELGWDWVRDDSYRERNQDLVYFFFFLAFHGHW